MNNIYIPPLHWHKHIHISPLESDDQHLCSTLVVVSGRRGRVEIWVGDP